jgi:predicted nucleotidyltransferase
MDEERLRQIAAGIAELYPCRRILLFGSRSRGDFHEGSDLNLCIVADAVPGEADADWLERSREVKRRVDLPDVELDPHVYTDAELKTLREREDPYALHMLAEGRVLYEQQ